MRLSTHGKPRIINCTDDFSRYLALPRGCLYEVIELLQEQNVTLELQDERNAGTSIEANFHGELREKQQEAVHELQKHDMGILSATTAFGKTVVGFGMLLFQGIRRSDFQIRKGDLPIHELYDRIIADEQRNELIFDDLLKALDRGRSPILLTDRTSHLEYFERKLQGFAKNIIVLRGGIGKKQWKQVQEKIRLFQVIRKGLCWQLEGLPEKDLTMRGWIRFFS